MEGTCLEFYPLKWAESLETDTTLAFVIRDTHGRQIIPVHVLEIQKGSLWDFVFKPLLFLFMGNDSHCSLDVTVV